MTDRELVMSFADGITNDRTMKGHVAQELSEMTNLLKGVLDEEQELESLRPLIGKLHHCEVTLRSAIDRDQKLLDGFQELGIYPSD